MSLSKVFNLARIYIEPHIQNIVVFLFMAKDIWKTLQRTYALGINVFHVYTLYEELFNLKQARRPL